MTNLNLSQISKEFKVSRSTIYRSINSGKLSRSADGSFDLVEVIRCFGEPISSHNKNVTTGAASEEAILKVKEEFDEYRRKTEEALTALKADKEFLQNHLKQLTYLLELKAPLSQETSQKHQDETSCDNTKTTSFKDLNNHETIVTHQNDTHGRNETTMKRGHVFGRVLRAILSQ